MDKDPSGQIKQFIYSCIDSVEMLEVLLLMHLDSKKSWSAESLSRELRSSINSATNRLESLHKFGLIKAGAKEGDYAYDDSDPEKNRLLHELAESYKTQRHRILSLIFSPMKKARDFADAFKLNKDEDKEK